MNLKKTIQKEVLEILHFLTDWNNISDQHYVQNIGLMTGLPGIILLMTDYYHNTSDSYILEKIKDYILKSFNILEQENILLTSYCSGLAGYGHFLLKIKNSEIFSESDEFEQIAEINDVLMQIDEILTEQIEVDFLDNNYDILHGAMGIGLYFLERENEKPLKKILDKLQEVSQTKGNQIFWTKLTNFDPSSNNIDFSSAHGVGSVLYFFSKITSKGHHNESILTLINGALNFYLNNSQDITEQINCFFPNYIALQEFIDVKNKPSNSRLAWCYGDLGILYNLYKTNILLGNKQESEKILIKLKHTTKRDFETEIIKTDYGFCHGSSGIGIIYMNLYQISKSEIFLAAAQKWVEVSLSSKVSITRSKYDFPKINNNLHLQDYSLLEGMGGLLLNYMVFLNYDMTHSQETLLLAY